MSRRITKVLTLFLVIMLSFGVIEPSHAASKKAPAKPVITSAVADGVNITISWKKAKRAKKYEIQQMSTDMEWVKYKTVKKTKKNKKKYTKPDKYKVVAKGKKYIVYKYDFAAEDVTITSKRNVTFNKLKSNTAYTFRIRSLNGKKHSKWRTVTTRTGVYSEWININGQPVYVAEGQPVTLPLPTIGGITIPKSVTITPERDEDYDYFCSEDGHIWVHGKDPAGWHSSFNKREDYFFAWDRSKYTWEQAEPIGHLSYGSGWMGWPEEFTITINGDNVKAVWTLDGTEPQLDQVAKYINAADYPFGNWTRGDSTIKVRGSATSTSKISAVRWADKNGYAVRRSAPMVIWAKLYQNGELIEEYIIIDRE